MPIDSQHDTAITRLTKDLKQGATTLSKDEARFLVSYYYLMQEDRIRAHHQERTLDESNQPHQVLTWLADNTRILEAQVKRALAAYTAADPVGKWAQTIPGIGPILAAGLLAHIDMQKCPTVGHIWSFAGLNPTAVWEKGQKRPWNADLKVICWKIGESFVKVSGRDGDIYGKLYLERKAFETDRNSRKEYADQAAARLAKFKIGKETDAYKAYIEGYLPKGHVHARAKRWAVKLFLSHWHHVAHQATFGRPPVKPYILDHGHGHVHEIYPPNWP